MLQYTITNDPRGNKNINHRLFFEINSLVGDKIIPSIKSQNKCRPERTNNCYFETD